MSWLRNPNAWSALIAAIAIGLSQSPPVHTWFISPELRISTRDTLTLTQFLGDLRLDLLLDLRNVGSGKVEISEVRCLLTDKVDDHWELTARWYYPQESPMQTDMYFLSHFPVPIITLQSEENWTEMVNCSRFPNPEEEEKISELITAARTNMDEKFHEHLRNQHAPGYSHPPLELDREIVNRAEDLFNERFSFKKGEYILFLTAFGLDNEILSVSGYQFTAYGHDIKLLNSQKKDYKYGYEILTNAHKPMNPTFVLKPMSADDASAEYNKIRR